MLRKKLSRGKVLEWFANLPPCLIGIEACPGAHYWARELLKLGHSVKLMPAQYVKAYVKGNKNDGNDAEAICEAVSRPGMRLVAINTEAQQEIQMLHRIRSRVMAERTALLNQIRGLLGEYGIVFGQGHPRCAGVSQRCSRVRTLVYLRWRVSSFWASKRSFGNSMSELATTMRGSRPPGRMMRVA